MQDIRCKKLSRRPDSDRLIDREVVRFPYQTGKGVVTIMMAETILRRGKRKLGGFLEKPGVSQCLWAGGYALTGFLLSGAGIRGSFQPIAVGVTAALSGFQAAAMTLGSMVGYRLLWGGAGIQGAVLAAGGGMLALTLGSRKKYQQEPLLLILLVGAMTAGLGLFYQLVFKEHTDLLTYFLRILLACGGTALGNQLLYHRDSFSDWLAGAALTLSLGQLMPIPYLGLGYLAAGCIASASSFPATALAGVGLDLAGITEMPMTAILSLSYFLRLIPFSERWVRYLSPAAAYLITVVLSGRWDPLPLPGLILGGGIGFLLPPPKHLVFRRGATAAAQVRLELSAGVMGEMQRLFLQQSEPKIDREALLQKARSRACGTCPCRKTCQVQNRLRPALLRNPLGINCRKTGRLVRELQRSSEQMKVMKLQRSRRQEYRSALIQQYGFLSDYLQYLSDQLQKREQRREPSFSVQASARSRKKEQANGDCCLAFRGLGCKYYGLLCDGMGTGLGAAEEGRAAAYLSRQMLKSGMPPEFVLQNINSILVLRGLAGAVTVDLCELRLDTGQATLYKWGAAPAWLVKNGRAEKIGTAGPPPGISIEEHKKAVRQLSLRRGEVLILLSDGVDGEAALHHLSWAQDISAGEVAEQILQNGCKGGEDDGTALVLRLRPASLVT